MDLLRDVDGLVMPSRWDAAPIVAIEAMRAGVPVLGSDRGALPEIVQDGVGGLIFELDEPDSLGRLLESIDGDQLRRLGQSARARWEVDYTSDGMNARTVEAYMDILLRSSCEPMANGSSK
jgi:glycosyltransferase involved in cell wall biosynthesis